MRSDVWFPAVESRNVLGRFIDLEFTHVGKSREAGHEVVETRPALESKIAGSNDVSHQPVKPFNKAELSARFPGAWEHYEQRKKSAPEPEPEVPTIYQTIPGTPLDKSDFLPRDRICWLIDQGFQTLEQLRDMSDAQVQNMGRGAAHWRRQAKAFLERT